VERKQLLGVIVDESSDMADLVEDLLVAARSDDGNIPVFPERVDLALLSQSVLSHLSVPDGVAVLIEDAPSVAYADPVRVRQIIRNLLTNAFRYGGAEIVVRFHNDEDRSYVDVHDNGDGINEEDQSAIFDPYGRAQTGNTVKASVGLGLTLSRRLAGLMGGRLEYIDGPGGTFRLGVPLPKGDQT
jgi:signal transduction histidine kinase